jgi:hypothetical protein
MNPAVSDFLGTFLMPPKGDSPEAIAERIRHWIYVANHPEEFVKDDPSPYAISAKRRTARQNLRRLVKNHEQIAASIMREHEAAK